MPKIAAIEDTTPKVMEMGRVRSTGRSNKLYTSHDLYTKHQLYFEGMWPGKYPKIAEIVDL